MSVQFGRWNFDGMSPAAGYVEEVRTVLGSHGPDGGYSYCADGITILYHAFQTTRDARAEVQPHVAPSGSVITWCGRLDNRHDLLTGLGDQLSFDSPDVSIAAATYDRMGTECLAQFLGDWALSIWSPGERSLILAKDPIGTCPLYYAFEGDHFTWSSVLDPLVVSAGHSFELDEEYIAGWLSSFPAAPLTPYAGIRSVSASSYVVVQNGRIEVRKYWNFDPSKRIRYRTDEEYEEHFRTVFRESVRRRLRADSPVLAELSGGLDSCSIVCMADEVISNEAGETPRLDTVSYFDDSEPNWDERPFFTKVEEKRGRTGCHIAISGPESFALAPENRFFAATPDAARRSSDTTRKFTDLIISHSYRVLLSGTGGDEVLGGVPTPIPELADLFAEGRVGTLARQLKIWALEKRRPWFRLLFESLRDFFPASVVGLPKRLHYAGWLQPLFAKRYRTALAGYRSRWKLVGALPSFQENTSALEALRRQLGCSAPPRELPYETRYPYLDRELLEFIYSIPREQLVRPGQRRSLMRRALTGIVPEEVLHRRRKAFISRAPRIAISTQSVELQAMHQHMISADWGIVDRHLFSEALRRAPHDPEVPLVPLMRTLLMEEWLREIDRRQLIHRPRTQKAEKRTREACITKLRAAT
jgi:asparagine synthase (glutamine-hydrolysing)